MAILQSMDGRFYQVPDEELAQHLIPADKLIETMRAAGYYVPGASEASAPASTEGMVMAYHGPPPHGPGPGPRPGGPGPRPGPRPGPGPGPGFGPLIPFFGPPAPPPVYFNYNDYRNFWGGW
jgi:hypothetical protein